MTVRSYTKSVPYILIIIQLSLILPLESHVTEFSLDSKENKASYPFNTKRGARKLLDTNRPTNRNSRYTYKKAASYGNIDSRKPSDRLLQNSSVQKYIAYYRKLKSKDNKVKNPKGRKLNFLESIAESQLNKYLTSPNTLQPYVNQFFGSFTAALDDLAKEKKKKQKNKKASKKLKSDEKNKTENKKLKKNEKNRTIVKTDTKKTNHGEELKMALTKTTPNDNNLVEAGDNPLKTLDVIYKTSDGQRKLDPASTNQIQSSFVPFDVFNTTNWNDNLLRMGAVSMGAGALYRKKVNTESHFKFVHSEHKVNKEELRTAAYDHIILSLKSCEDALTLSMRDFRIDSINLNKKIESITNEFQSMDTGSRPGERVVEMEGPANDDEDEEEPEGDDKQDNEDVKEEREKGKKGSGSLVLIERRHLADSPPSKGSIQLKN